MTVFPPVKHRIKSTPKYLDQGTYIEKADPEAMDHPDDNQMLRHILPAKAASASGELSRPLSNDASESAEEAPIPSHHPRRRAPITNVACQGCRKRKTKCDGQRPKCNNCAKRGITQCQYDAEGTQSNKIAIYKSKLERQDSRISELERENSRLREANLLPGGSSTPLESYSLNSVFPAASYPKLPPMGMDSSTVLQSSHTLFNSTRLPQDDIRARYEQNLIDIPPLTKNDSTSSDESLVVNKNGRYQNLLDLTNQEDLRKENTQLRELMVFLTLLDDRTLAEKMALRIRDDGVTDTLLSEANDLFVSGRVKHPQYRPIATTQTPKLPALSSLDLPTISAPFTPELEPDLQGYRYPPPSQMLSARSGQGLPRGPWQ